ncbi:hypothetical protein GMORB2_0292 [Geosmithia morbida]|uniref:Uncharacterized protein n=1 Tax=Geosmithia morbida TaxID=1094350 RepID=A0A9P5D7E6_9HYPO|nr:uncharacterized protein GMORB2_0292 [Geosmithia morbida]KAF4126556.1 hypothetical protein GMORB2_0292 [Geosmithia morbida]
MTPTRPVPSRAALHALRGLVFTTSCSVILLAEERRRRTKLARTAIDNARKLHTVKAQRRPIAMLEASRHADSDLELLATDERTINPLPRRKRRQRPAPTTTETHSETGPPPVTSRMGTNEHAVKIASAYDTRHSLDLVLAASHAAASRYYNPTNLPPSAPERRLSSASLSTPDLDRPHIMAAPGLSMPRDLTTVRALGSVPERRDSESGPLVTDVLSFLDSRDPHGQPATGIRLLECLLERLELASPIPKETVATYQGLALDIVGRITPQRSTSRSERESMSKLRFYAMRLLRTATHLDGIPLRRALDALMPMYRDVPEFIVPVMQWLSEARNNAGMRDFLHYLADGTHSDYVLDYPAVLELLRIHHKRYGKLADTRLVYRELVDAGVSEVTSAPEDMEYEIHSLFLQLSSRSSVYDSIYALAGRSTSIEDELRALGKVKGQEPEQLKFILRRLTDICSGRVAPEAFEDVLRTVASKHALPLKGRWLYPVLQHHSKRLDREAMLSFLQFALDHGYKPTDKFFYKICHLWRKQWNMSEESIQQLYEALRETMPNLSAPVDSVGGTAKQEDWEAMYIRSATRVDPEGSVDAKALASLQKDALAGRWDRVWTRYATAEQPPSLGALRLGVIARLKLDGGSTARTSQLMADAHSQGLDISQAMTPLLLAQIAEGRDAGELVRSSLDQGITLHDMVYNKAARALSAGGKLDAAVAVCNSAAAENGAGDACYSGFNFANLVFSYTGLYQYEQLTRLLSGFRSEKRWWAGSTVAMEAVKHSMKTVARRLTTARGAHNVRRGEAMLGKLSDAYYHCRQCKADAAGAVFRSSTARTVSPSDPDRARREQQPKTTDGAEAATAPPAASAAPAAPHPQRDTRPQWRRGADQDEDELSLAV